MCNLVAGEAAEWVILLTNDFVGRDADSRTISVGPLLTRAGAKQSLVFLGVQALATDATGPGRRRRLRRLSRFGSSLSRGHSSSAISDLRNSFWRAGNSVREGTKLQPSSQFI